MSAPATAVLLRRLATAAALSLPGEERLLGHVHVRAIAARQAAFHEDEDCSCVFVVQSGLFKQLYTKSDGTEWIKSFAGPGDLFACLKAIGEQSPTTFASVAIEHSVVERIDYRLIETLAEASLPWQKAVRIAFQRLAEIKVQRERDLLTLSARELYRRLAESAPQWVGRVPQKDLAGFLGVTPVGLNRIIRGDVRARSIAADTRSAATRSGA